MKWHGLMWLAHDWKPTPQLRGVNGGPNRPRQSYRAALPQMLP